MQISKYSASGNDFIIFDAFTKEDRSSLARKLCDRHLGIGADGLIILLPHEECDFQWQFYNSDGSEAEMCGNGSRACAHYAYKNSLAPKKMKFLTDAGVIEASVNRNIVEVKLTEPKVVKKEIVEEGFVWTLVDTGVPHLVTFVKDLSLFDKKISSKLREKYNANVNFAKIKNDSIHVRTYERGVENETLACGTGMAACYFCAFLEGHSKKSSKVYPASKEELTLSYKKSSLYFKGTVNKVFDTIL